MGMNKMINRILGPFAIALLLAVTTTAYAKPSDQWQLELSGSARSNGEIVIRLNPIGADPIEVTAQIAEGTSENMVAQALVDALRLQLSREVFHVDRVDGEDVMIKKAHGAADFDLQVISNTVEHVKISPDRE